MEASPATVQCPAQDKSVSTPDQSSRKRDKYQLLELYKHFPWQSQDYDLSRIIGEGAKLTAVVSSIDPKEKTGGKLYHRVRRLLNNLVDLNLVEVTGNWSYGDMLEKPGNGVQPSSTLITLTNRMQNSNHVAHEITDGWRAVVDHYLPDDKINEKAGPCKTCTFWKNTEGRCTTDKKQCPYRLSVCSRAERKRAAWKLRAIDGRQGKHHWMFVRKETKDGKKIVQPALSARLGTVQTHFTNYLDDVKKRVIILRRIDGKETRQKWTEKRDQVEHLCKDGTELVLDYQTRFTDEGRTKEEIKKFHDTWKEAGKNYDGAVFLTLTSDPASNASLWDVNRHFAPAWNTYLQLLTKRFRAKRRDELIAVLLSDLKTRDSDRWIRVDRERRENQEKVAREIRQMEDRKGYAEMPKAEQQARRFRIERKLDPWLGLTNEEKFTIRADLEYRTMPDGTVIKESYRPVYLAVYEFMENGLLHSHITIFGTTWIDRIDQIKADWDRLGQGAMAHAYAMNKSPSGVWEWLGKPPADSRNRQPVDYLIKYLIKGLYTKEGHGMYWAMNKRFFTRSRSLDGGWIDYSDGKTVWELLASLHEDQIPMAIKKQQRGAPVLRAWYDAHGWGGSPGPGVPA